MQIFSSNRSVERLAMKTTTSSVYVIYELAKSTAKETLTFASSLYSSQTIAYSLVHVWVIGGIYNQLLDTPFYVVDTSNVQRDATVLRPLIPSALLRSTTKKSICYYCQPAFGGLLQFYNSAEIRPTQHRGASNTLSAGKDYMPADCF